MRNKAMSNIVPKNVLREVQLETLKIISDSLSNSYGPDGSYTAIRQNGNDKNPGSTHYTKDGHTILSRIFFNRPIELSVIDNLTDITRHTVCEVGDGTTSAIMLSYYIFNQLKNAHDKFHISENKLVDDLKKASKEICDLIKENAKPMNMKSVYEIAFTATNGNKKISESIASIYRDFGKGVWIDVGVNNTDEDVIKEYDGLTLESGFFNSGFVNNSKKLVCALKAPELYIFEDPVDTGEMYRFIAEIMKTNIYDPLEKMKKREPAKMIPTVILCPAIGGDMRTMIDQYLSVATSLSPESRPPFLLVTNIHKKELLSDLAKLSGAKMIKKYIDNEIQKKDIDSGLAPTPQTIGNFCGFADEIVSDTSKTKIVNPKLMHNEDGSFSDTYNELVSSLEEQLKFLEKRKEELTEINKLRRRIQSLKCNMVDLFIGGISMTDRDAIRDSVEDAVLNCRSADKYGVGNGANFEALRASLKLEDDFLKQFSAEERKRYIDMEEYSIYTIITKAYIQLCAKIYESYVDGDFKKASAIVFNGVIAKKCPFNLRTKAYDGNVLTSIEADQVIIDAISKIVGMMFVTNQYLCGDPVTNVYDID